MSYSIAFILLMLAKNRWYLVWIRGGLWRPSSVSVDLDSFPPMDGSVTCRSHGTQARSHLCDILGFPLCLCNRHCTGQPGPLLADLLDLLLCSNMEMGEEWSLNTPWPYFSWWGEKYGSRLVPRCSSVPPSFNEYSLVLSHECIILGGSIQWVSEGRKCLIVDFVSCAGF